MFPGGIGPVCQFLGVLAGFGFLFVYDMAKFRCFQQPVPLRQVPGIDDAVNPFGDPPGIEHVVFLESEILEMQHDPQSGRFY